MSPRATLQAAESEVGVWCTYLCAGAMPECGRAMRWEPGAGMARCCAINVVRLPVRAARSAAEPWKVGAEKPRVGMNSSPVKGSSQE